MPETDTSFAYASASERRERLAQFVTGQGYCTILELAQRFGVSEMTIRRDVGRLVGEGRLRSFHGGVGSLVPTDILGVDYTARHHSHADAKRAIAARAVRMVRPGAVIAIDAGTTPAGLAGLLGPELRAQIITPSLPVVSTLATHPGVEVTCLGGILHSESLSFSGPSTLAAISNLHVETLFLAASGLGERGAFCGNGFDAITKRALIDVSDNVVLLADASKFTTSSMVRVCGWDAIDVLVTDDALRREDEEMLAHYEVTIEKARSTHPDNLELEGSAS